jgi:hypothetical protein
MDAVIKAHEALIQLMSIIVRAEWDPDNSGPEDICEPYVEWLIFSAENMAALWPELQERDLRERRRL